MGRFTQERFFVAAMVLAACHRHPRPVADPNSPASDASNGRGKQRLPTADRPNGGGELDQRLDELAQALSAKLSRDDHLAISDYPDLNGQPSDLGKHISEELATRLLGQGRAHIVDRSHMQQVMKEQKLGASQMVDDATAAHIGQLLGANLISTGTVSDLGSLVKVNARIIDTSSGEVIAASAVSLSRSGPVARLLDGKILAAPENPSPKLMVFVKKAPPEWSKDALIVVNKSPWCLRLHVGAEELRTFDKAGEVQCIAAGEKAFVNIPAYGEYAIMALGGGTTVPFTATARYERVFYFSKKNRTLELRDRDFGAVQ